MNPLTFTTEDFRTPERLERLFRRLNQTLAEPPPPPVLPDLKALAAVLAPLIRAQLQAPGIAPLNLQSLLPESGLGIVLEDTHSNRLALYPASSTEVGALFWETDRTVAYIVTETAGARSWDYFSGTMQNTLANRPTDLGADDAGFRFVVSTADQNAEYIWTGTEFVTVDYLQEITDAATNSITQSRILRHLSTGTPAAGFGARETIQLMDGAGQTEDALAFDTDWSNAASGAETSRLAVLLRSAGAALAVYFAVLTTGLRFRVGGFLATITHANGATRTYTFSDATGSVPSLPTAATTETGTGAIVRTSSPTLVTPTIASFANANHNHQNAAGGGALDAAAIASGTIGVANGGTGASTAAGARSNLSAAEIQVVGGNGPGTYTTITSITVTAEGTISAISGS